MRLPYTGVAHIAALLGAISLLPQIYTLADTQDGCGLSPWFLYLRVITAGLWLLYGMANDLLPNTVASRFSILSLTVLVVLRSYYVGLNPCGEEGQEM